MPSTYEIVQANILSLMEKGTVPWHKSWNTEGGAMMPRSISTKRPYRGVNTFVLFATALDMGYDSPWWGTFNRWNDLGARIITGEHNTPVSFFKFIHKRDEETDEIEVIPLHRFFKVWNFNQVEWGENEPPEWMHIEPVVVSEFEQIEEAERVLKNYKNKPPVEHKGVVAMYTPPTDKITMPKPERFENSVAYYLTLFHEHTHGTGHETRLGRDLKSLLEDGHSYSFEELIAEMGAAFLCAHCGMDFNIENSVGYIQHWLDQLRENKTWVVRAGNRAQAAVDYILGVEWNGNND